MTCYKKDDNKICSEANTEIINKVNLMKENILKI